MCFNEFIRDFAYKHLVMDEHLTLYSVATYALPKI